MESQTPGEEKQTSTDINGSILPNGVSYARSYDSLEGIGLIFYIWSDLTG